MFVIKRLAPMLAGRQGEGMSGPGVDFDSSREEVERAIAIESRR
jgi:hypothetical protein